MDKTRADVVEAVKPAASGGEPPIVQPISEKDNRQLAQIKSGNTQNLTESRVLPDLSIANGFANVNKNFDAIDKRRDGQITKQEIDDYIKNNKNLKSDELTALTRVRNQIEKLKGFSNDSGLFNGITKGDLNAAYAVDKAMDFAQRNFGNLDSDGNGKITGKELDAYVRARGDKHSAAELHAIKILNLKETYLEEFSNDEHGEENSGFTLNDLENGRKQVGTDYIFFGTEVNGQRASSYDDLRPALEYLERKGIFDALDSDKNGFISKGEIDKYSQSNKDKLSPQAMQNLRALRERIDKVEDLNYEPGRENIGISRADITAARDQIDAYAYARKNFDKLDGDGNGKLTVQDIQRYIRISGSELSSAELGKLEILKKQVGTIQRNHDDEWFRDNDGATRDDLLDALEELGSGGVRYGEPVAETQPADKTPPASDTPPDQVGQPKTGDRSDDKREKTADGTHTVERGDSLWKICKGELRQRNSGTEPTNADILKMVKEMTRLNSLADPNLIRPGDKLKFPAAVTSSVPAREEPPMEFE